MAAGVAGGGGAAGWGCARRRGWRVGEPPDGWINRLGTLTTPREAWASEAGTAASGARAGAGPPCRSLQDTIWGAMDASAGATAPVGQRPCCAVRSHGAADPPSGPPALRRHCIAPPAFGPGPWHAPTPSPARPTQAPRLWRVSSPQRSPTLLSGAVWPCCSDRGTMKVRGGGAGPGGLTQSTSHS